MGAEQIKESRKPHGDGEVNTTMTGPEQLYIGLDVGRTIRGALVGADGSILRQHRVVSEVCNARIFIDQLIDVIRTLHSDAREVAAAGIGWAGLVNQRAQRIEVNR